MYRDYQMDAGEPFGQLISTCPRCGGPLRLSSYKLEHQSNHRRECQAIVPICPDGFAVCDDLWGTQFENVDQSTADEVVECVECGRLGLLLIRGKDDVAITVRASMLEKALELISTIKPTSERKIRKMGYDPLAELIADLKAALD
jgi:hypothetical protein